MKHLFYTLLLLTLTLVFFANGAIAREQTDNTAVPPANNAYTPIYEMNSQVKSGGLGVVGFGAFKDALFSANVTFDGFFVGKPLGSADNKSNLYFGLANANPAQAVTVNILATGKVAAAKDLYAGNLLNSPTATLNEICADKDGKIVYCVEPATVSSFGITNSIWCPSTDASGCTSSKSLITDGLLCLAAPAPSPRTFEIRWTRRLGNGTVEGKSTVITIGAGKTCYSQTDTFIPPPPWLVEPEMPVPTILSSCIAPLTPNTSAGPYGC